MSELIKNTNMYFTSGDGHGCGLYRTVYPAQMLGKDYNIGFPVAIDPKNPLSAKALQDRDNSEVLFIQRATHEYFLTAIPEMKASGKKIVYDIDDNLWEIPSTNPAFRPYNRPLQKQTKEIMKLCDAITVSTNDLKEYFLSNRFNKNVHVIPNFLHHVAPEIPKVGNKVRVGWWGTNTHAGDYSSKLIFTLDKIKDKYDNVELVFIGWNPMNGAKNRYEFHDFQPAENFLDFLNKRQFDILCAPLIDNEFNRCKSNIKFLEAGACRVAPILSNVGPYKCATHSKNALLISNDKEWEIALTYLIENEVYRQEIASNAFDFVKDNFTYERNGQLIIDKYEGLLKSL